MKPLLLALLLGAGLSAASATPAVAYPVDCAILLCLAGGWPASAQCAHARAVFIRRITPWPIEPPLQIWNCPMRARLPQQKRPMERVFEIALHGEKVPLVSAPVNPHALQLVNGRVDVDILGTVLDVIRSIRVFEISYQQQKSSDGSCNTVGTVHLGSYGAQGDYSRRRSSVTAVPSSSKIAVPADCRLYAYRSVFVEWRDYEGSYDHEEVRY